MAQVMIENITNEGLRVERWSFSTVGRYGDVEFILDFYGNGKRLSKRHKFRFDIGECYKRIDPRGYNLSLNDVPFNDAIAQRVREKVNIRVSKSYG